MTRRIKQKALSDVEVWHSKIKTTFGLLNALSQTGGPKCLKSTILPHNRKSFCDLPFRSQCHLS